MDSDIHNYELAFHHEFTSKTQSTELKVQTIIIDIEKSDECLVLRALHAVKNGAVRIVLCTGILLLENVALTASEN